VKLVTIQEAAEWASDFLKKEISSSNISYLIQYGKVHKHRDNGATLREIGRRFKLDIIFRSSKREGHDKTRSQITPL